MLLQRKFYQMAHPVIPPPPDGTYGLFKVGSSSLLVDKYSYADNVVSSATSLTSVSDALEAFSNDEKAMFIHSLSSPGELYTFATNTVANGAAINTSLGTGSGSAGIDTDSWVFINTATPVRQYNYAAGTYSSQGSLTVTPNGASAAGNDTYAVTTVGGASPGTKTTNIYTYASNSAAAGTDLQVNTRSGLAAGNLTRGVFSIAGSAASAATNTYNYSSGLTTASGSLTSATTGLSAAGNSVYGVFEISTLSAGRGTNRYEYGSETSIVGTVLSAVVSGTSCAAASNGISGVTA